MNQTRPVIGISMGDPVGIGPEILLKALGSSEVFECCRPVVLGDAAVLGKTNDLLGANLHFNIVSSMDQCQYVPDRPDLIVLSDLSADELAHGAPTPRTGQAMIDYITRATDLAIEGKIDAMVTCPINKLSMKKAGSEFHGHTEMIAARTGTDRFVMMMSGQTLSVVLVTIHIPLSKVQGSITVDKIADTIRITGQDLKNRFGIKKPRIAVAALNPHAGEEGLFGNEESTLIAPAIELVKHEGFDVSGPHPPDTVYVHAATGLYDVVVSMYHDQGLIPFKLLHFKDGVNTTLGLPIIRTSVDHGTAYDIAGKNIADPSSLIEAIRLAARQASHTKGFK